ncbi:SpvB/TcaC N-terminal domain-containing protein [Streptomyces endophyticus]|uniref:Sugar-binding protein n=1 Tax=Streptomyces endophyticus TaxID=714166 RepID=A0ABU6F6L2_9ACTN|nr:SpvB/TcaC N-terminal domain-containing protein [Streptomyces endophyticus]MEB8338472.1 sugar-binding protein [Streptomyces endophyticus]
MTDTASDTPGASTGTPFVPPAISVPKGGGAIRGIDEKFTATPATGTGTVSVPVATSPGRSGFGPQLSLSYDSGTGNGLFGFGWRLSASAITRRTDRGVPRYHDVHPESDDFLFNGEELVPELSRQPDGTWTHPVTHRPPTSGPRWRIERYRPRVEGSFARTERWTDLDSGIAHWRTISRDNVTTLYGRTAESRVHDPADPRRVFSWLICETFDDRGNAVLYRYKPEDAADTHPARPNERNRSRGAARHIKRILYGNRTPRATDEDLTQRTDWMFEVVLDYGEHGDDTPDERAIWPCREDPFSTYRAGFEIRTYRLCRRVLMFHHFKDEPGVGANCLVRSTELTYVQGPVASFLTSVTSRGYAPGLVSRALPPLEFEYSAARISDVLRDLDAVSARNLPDGIDGDSVQWTDLAGTGVSGALLKQPDGWLYKANLSPLDPDPDRAALGPAVPVPTRPTTTGGAQFGADGSQLMDLDGDGRLDLVRLDRTPAGFNERAGSGGWAPFTVFGSLPALDWDSPDLRFVDLTGDGTADVLLTEDRALTWYPSLHGDGFAAAEDMPWPRDEEAGPAVRFADGTESVFTADMCGDGLSALVRIRNGEICYWPNLGHGRFGPKVTMDDAPVLAPPDRFDPRRALLLDVDGTGCADLCYFADDGVRLYLNQSGNGWGNPRELTALPPGTQAADTTVTDLLGNGTACLVLSSPSTAAVTRRPVRYLDLMGGVKPHLLTKMRNNLGAETTITYASSAKFALQDEAAGRPWITRLPFPVHVVERTETYDRIGRCRFVTRYAYHHGHYEDREFRGFARVEQYDAEAFDVAETAPANIDAASHLPSALTTTWFHTGACEEGDAVSLHLAAEYYREPGLPPAELPDTPLPDTLLTPRGRHPFPLGPAEEREVRRALKGSVLRTEVRALDGTTMPYTVTEQNFGVELLQPVAGGNRYAVVFLRPRESIELHYERRLREVAGKQVADPRVGHTLTLDVDAYGDVLTSVTVAYGRRHDDPSLPQEDRDRQRRSRVTCTESAYTAAVDTDDAHRAPLPSETRTYELLNVADGPAPLAFGTVAQRVAQAAQAAEIPYENHDAKNIGAAPRRRRIDQLRTLYRADDLSGLLPLHQMGPLALPGETYTLAFTAGVLAEQYARGTETLIQPGMLAAAGYRSGASLKPLFPPADADDHWWLPSGTVFYSPDPGHSAQQELALARGNFFLPCRFRDPFAADTVVTYDTPHHLLMRETLDPVGNRVSATLDYRVLRPSAVTDPNRNRTVVAFDSLGMIVATAVQGKNGEGDSLDGTVVDLPEATVSAYLADPLSNPAPLLKRATTRLVHDLFAYHRTRHLAAPAPPLVALLSRETHDADGPTTRIQHRFSYSDGFGREIQSKVRAEPAGPNIQWLCTGWTIFNNKGSPFRTYEPSFTPLHTFQFAKQVGVSTILLYDPVQRVVATVHPHHAYEKTVFDAWHQTTWDVNDTVAREDPRSDPDVGALIARLPEGDVLPTWYTVRKCGALGGREKEAAAKALGHAGTPSRTDLDALGRVFRTETHNRFVRSGAIVEERYVTREFTDIEGNARSVWDARGHLVMTYGYGLVGNRIRAASMEAGTRWTLNDALGKPLFTWDSQNRRVETRYDAARRPLEVRLRTGVSGTGSLIEKTEYGEAQGDAENMRGKLYRTFDAAGIVTSDRYDFKGNLLRSRRRLCTNYREPPDWSANPPLEPALPAAATTFDALNRPTSRTTPDGSTTLLTYNEGGLLETVSVRVAGAAAKVFVQGIDYDAKGQRRRIEYGNGAATTYRYDSATYRLTELRTVRDATPATVQHLTYTYDPVGNVIDIRDDAQQTVFFKNARVEPHTSYTYDAVYRLVEAVGREHTGQAGAAPRPPTATDLPVVAHPDDGTALAGYREEYTYDAVGNLDLLVHRGTDPAHSGWTRDFTYAASSNRLSSSTLSGVTGTETFRYDEHGNTLEMPHLAVMRWNHRDQLQSSAHDVGPTDGAPETTYYVYDSTGERVRKVTDKQRAGPSDAAVPLRERVYLGGVEFYREYNGDGTATTLERAALHVMDDTGRIALVEHRVKGTDGSPAELTRYQLGNHLGSATVELADDGEVITYEEYFPYGSSAFRSAGTQTNIPKRYRYSAMEHDEENGLAYHGARYYVPWLGRWSSCDPSGTQGGINLYRYGSSNPVRFVDTHGRDTLDKVGGYYAGFWDSVIGTQVDMLFKREEFRESYARSREIFDWRKFPSVVAARKDVISNKYSANIAGGTLGLMSGFVPGAPDGSDLPESVQYSYSMMRFASTNATAIVGHVETFGALRMPPSPPLGPPPAPAAVGVVAAPVVVEMQVSSVLMAASSGGKGAPSAPTNGKEWAEKWKKEEVRGKEFREKENGPDTIDREIEVWVEEDPSSPWRKAPGIRIDAANQAKRLMEEWTTPNQIAQTAPGAGKWDQIIRRMGLWQEARDNGWRLHGWSQVSGKYIGDITDWQLLTTKYPHWNWPSVEPVAPAAAPPVGPKPK